MDGEQAFHIPAAAWYSKIWVSLCPLYRGSVSLLLQLLCPDVLPILVCQVNNYSSLQVRLPEVSPPLWCRSRFFLLPAENWPCFPFLSRDTVKKLNRIISFMHVALLYSAVSFLKGKSRAYSLCVFPVHAHKIHCWMDNWRNAGMNEWLWNCENPESLQSL